VLALAGLVVLISLGTWQLNRRAWKEALIATLQERVHAAPIALPERNALRTEDEFTRVRLRVEFDLGTDALLYAPNSALRDDVKTPGYFVFAPARLADGTRIVVNRGYVPNRTYPAPQGPQDMVGYVRWPEGSSWFVADHDQSGAVWYVRDPAKMAKVRGWGEVVPFYIEQESPVPPGGLPHPSSLNPQLRNDHLQYALTWYGLALTLLGVFAVWLWGRLRQTQPTSPG
jgi:cytochrome oxidase assembly protein ShyY1